MLWFFKDQNENNNGVLLILKICTQVICHLFLVLRERKERLMNGSLYKIRAVVKKSVKLQKEEQQELQVEAL